MKKILYITVEDFSKNNNGVIKKIKFQQNAFSKFGFACDLLYSQDNNIYINNNFIKKSYNRYYRRLFFFYNLYRYINFSSCKSLYIRYPGSNIFFIKFLKKVKKENIKTIIEIPTYPYDNEAKGFLMKIFNFIDKIYRKQLYKYADRLVTFSDDDEIYGIKTIKINNGIDINKIFLIENKEKKDNEINFIGVANLAFWHGFDRFILSMAEYYKSSPSQKIKFYIVGDGDKKILNDLKKLVKENSLERYVIFYGYKSGKELDEVYNKTDIAVGSLGFSRANMKEGSPLKTREYIAKGLPVVLGYDDLSLKSTLDFIYQVPNDESIFDLCKILDWYKNLDSDSIKIRKYAEDNLTWDKQMKKVIDYILETEEKEEC